MGKYIEHKDESKIIDIETGEVVDKNKLKRMYQQEAYDAFVEINNELLDIGEKLELRIVRDKRGVEYNSINVKEGFHFVKVFKVDVRYTLEKCDLSFYARGYLYSCLAYINFPTNTLIINGETPTNEVICENFKMSKGKLYQVYKELEDLTIIKRKKVNGQWITYINPFLHSIGLVDIETYNLFKDSIFNPYASGGKESVKN